MQHAGSLATRISVGCMQEHSCVGDVRGVGLMVGIEFVAPFTSQHAPDIAAKVQAPAVCSPLYLLFCHAERMITGMTSAFLN